MKNKGKAAKYQRIRVKEYTGKIQLYLKEVIHYGKANHDRRRFAGS